MNARFFVPTSFEIPKNPPTSVHVFGMGPRKAEQLAATINEANYPEASLVVFGCAGALRRGLSPGDTFLIHSVHYNNNTFDLTIPASLAHHPRAKLCTSDVLVESGPKKHFLHQKTQADLVDMEMGALWQSTRPEIRTKYVFVRTVIDRVDDRLAFFVDANGKVSLPLQSILQPSTWVSIAKFLMAATTYRRSMQKFLQGIQ